MTLKKYDEIMEKIKVTPGMRERVLERVDAEMEKAEEERILAENSESSVHANLHGLESSDREKMGGENRENKNKIYKFAEKSDELKEGKLKETKKGSSKKRGFRAAWKYMTAACLVIAAATAWTVSRPYLPGQNGIPGQSGVPGETESVQIPNPLEEVSSVKELSDLVGFEVKELEAIPFAVQQASYISISREVAEIIYTGADQELIYRKSKGTEDNSGNYVVYSEEAKRSVDGYEVTVKGDDGRCSLAVWTDGTYSYSIQMREGESVSYEELDAMIEKMR